MQQHIIEIFVLSQDGLQNKTMFTTALTYLVTQKQLKFLKIELTKTQVFWISKKDDEKIQFLQNLKTTSDVKLTIQTLEI